VEADLERLRALNLEIGEAESRGDRAFLEQLLAPAFAMRRASGAVVDRDAFLEEVQQSAERPTAIQSINVLAQNRAVVMCIVIMDGTAYANLRVFTRESPGHNWQLLAWANEPA